MGTRLSIRICAEKLGLDTTEMVVVKGHLYAPSGSDGDDLFRWDSEARRWLRGKFGLGKPVTVNDSKRRLIHYSGQRGREL